MRNLIFMCLLLLGSVANAAENKTKLVVGITVSNFYPEWLDVYQRELTSGGLRRIMQGSVKLKADYDYLFSQSGTDQATIYTGLLPSEHGMVMHDWYDRLRGRRQGNVASEQYMADRRG